MSATFMHVGIPITRKKAGMTYNADFHLWMSSPDVCDFKIEYLKYEEETPFPEVMHKNPHVAFRVDDLDRYLAEADRVIFGPANAGETVRVAFIIKDDTIFELYEDNSGAK